MRSEVARVRGTEAACGVGEVLKEAKQLSSVGTPVLIHLTSGTLHGRPCRSTSQDPSGLRRFAFKYPGLPSASAAHQDTYPGSKGLVWWKGDAWLNTRGVTEWGVQDTPRQADDQNSGSQTSGLWMAIKTMKQPWMGGPGGRFSGEESPRRMEYKTGLRPGSTSQAKEGSAARKPRVEGVEECTTLLKEVGTCG